MQLVYSYNLDIDLLLFIWKKNLEPRISQLDDFLFSSEFVESLQVILCIFCTANSILTLVRAFSFAFGGLRAAVKVHDTLLKRLINAPVQFFDQTPGGRILNRLESLSSVSQLINYTLIFILILFILQAIIRSVHN